MRTKTKGTPRGDDAAATSTRASNAVLDVENLTVRYKVAEGYFTAVDNVSFSVAPGEQVAIVAIRLGKTNTCLAIAGLLTHPNAVIGGMPLRSREPRLRSASACACRSAFPDLRWSSRMEYVLDPVWTVGSQLIDILRATQKISPQECQGQGSGMATQGRHGRTRASDEELPYELSGGMRQRVMVALALGGSRASSSHRLADKRDGMRPCRSRSCSC